MHKMCNLDKLCTSHFSDIILKKFWKRHLSIDINGDVIQKMSRKSCKMLNTSQLKYSWSRFNKINQVINLFI